MRGRKGQTTRACQSRMGPRVYLCCNPYKPYVNMVSWFMFPERDLLIFNRAQTLPQQPWIADMLWEPRRWNWEFRGPGQRVCDIQYCIEGWYVDCGEKVLAKGNNMYHQTRIDNIGEQNEYIWWEGWRGRLLGNEIRKTIVRFSWPSTILLKKENFHSFAKVESCLKVCFFSILRTEPLLSLLVLLNLQKLSCNMSRQTHELSS